MRPSWDEKFMVLAAHYSTWSKDRTHQVGCIIVDENNISRMQGYNGFPRGIDDNVEARHERPAKYQWTEHAERNAIYNAARIGVGLEGTRIYIPWFPCVDCTRGIIQSGIVEIICYAPDFGHHKYGPEFKVAEEMIREAGVNIRYIGNSPEQKG